MSTRDMYRTTVSTGRQTDTHVNLYLLKQIAMCSLCKVHNLTEGRLTVVCVCVCLFVCVRDCSCLVSKHLGVFAEVCARLQWLYLSSLCVSVRSQHSIVPLQ